MENIEKILQERKMAEERAILETEQKEQNDTLTETKKTIAELEVNTQQADFVKDSLRGEEETVRDAERNRKTKEESLGAVAEKYGMTVDQIVSDEALSATPEVQALITAKQFETDLSENRTLGNEETKQAFEGKMSSMGIEASSKDIEHNASGVLYGKTRENEKDILEKQDEQEAVIQRVVEDYSYEYNTPFRNLLLKERSDAIEKILLEKPIHNFSEEN